LILETILLGGGTVDIDVPALKEAALRAASKIKDEKDFDRVEADLLKAHTIKPKVEKVAAAVNAGPAEEEKK
jgi:hypothetical protein